MNFQSQQERAQASTLKLTILFGLGLIGVVVALGGLASLWFFTEGNDTVGKQVFAFVAPLTSAGILGCSMVKGAQIREGGGAYLATSLGGWPVDFNTHDPAELQLVNIVEEIAIASGVPVPHVFVLRSEPGINAFAAGWNSGNAVIGVTRGALQYLTRSELQGVIAHEFSHIANGDTKVKTRIIGWVFGIAAITILGKIVLRSVGRGRKADARALLVLGAIGLSLVVVGAVGTWFGRLMQAAVSRQREHLADASAVQYTRNPDGLAGALIKIAAFGKENNILSAHAVEAGHLFFESPSSSRHATHPPLEKRIRALMPSWDGTYPKLKKAELGTYMPLTINGRTGPIIPGVPETGGPLFDGKAIDLDGQAIGTDMISTGTPLDPFLETAIILDAFGNGQAPASESPEPTSFEEPTLGPPSDEHLEYARELIDRIPQELRDYLHTESGAVAAILGLLVSRDPQIREGELESVSEVSGFESDYLDSASRVIGNLHRPLQLPAIDIAMQSIRETPEQFHASMRNVIEELETARPDEDLFRWMLKRVVLRHLEDADDHGEMRYEFKLQVLAEEASIVYAMISRFNGAGDTASIQQAFQAAHRIAGLARPTSLPSPKTVADHLDASLEQLEHMTFANRWAFVEGAIAAVRFDAHTTADEAELVRVIAETLRVPMPPILPTIESEEDQDGMAA